MNVLAIGAHPDDIEYGCGGLLLEYHKQGAAIYLAVMTDGAMAGDPQVRRAEQAESARLMGAKDIFWGGYEDTKLPMDQTVIATIEEKLKVVRPSLVLVQGPTDTHQDHRALTQATLSATRYTSNVLFYEGPTTKDFLPTVFVNIAEVVEGKMNLLQAHESQVEKTNIEDMSIIDLARSNATARGILGRVRYAEAFMPVRLFLLADPEQITNAVASAR